MLPNVRFDHDLIRNSRVLTETDSSCGRWYLQQKNEGDKVVDRAIKKNSKKLLFSNLTGKFAVRIEKTQANFFFQS